MRAKGELLEFAAYGTPGPTVYRALPLASIGSPLVKNTTDPGP